MGPKEEGAERCGEHAHPPSQLLLSKALLPFGLDEFRSFALEMGCFGCLHRSKESLSLEWQGWGPLSGKCCGVCWVHLKSAAPLWKALWKPLCWSFIFFRVNTKEYHRVGDWCQMLKGGWTKPVWSTPDTPLLTEFLFQKCIKQNTALIRLSFFFFFPEIKNEVVAATSEEIIKEDELKCS